MSYYCGHCKTMVPTGFHECKNPNIQYGNVNVSDEDFANVTWTTKAERQIEQDLYNQGYTADYVEGYMRGLKVGKDEYAQQVRLLRSALTHISAIAGNPDPAEACRLIIKRVKEALE